MPVSIKSIGIHIGGYRYKNFDPFTYNGPLTFHQRQKEMITDFFEFYQYWKAQRGELILCTDNIMVDAYHIKHMIDTYMPEQEPFPFDENGYDTRFLDVDSMVMGIPIWRDDISPQRWWDIISDYNGLPESDHKLHGLPFSDAYTIGRSMFTPTNYSSG